MRPLLFKLSTQIFTLFIFSLGFLPSHAAPLDYDLGGYLSLTAGKVIGGDARQAYMEDVVGGFDCPCYVADYAGVGVYEDDELSFEPDSGYGLNGRLNLSEDFLIGAQIEGRGGNDAKPELTYLYVRYEINNHINVDLGRKALPLYYYSDFLNVSYAYPWIRVSGDVYGWPLTSYNGISASYTGDWGDASYTIGTWYGEEEDDDNRSYNEIYWGAESFSVKWSKIKGLTFEYDRDWLVLRAVGMISKDEEIANWGAGDIEVISDNVDQDFFGLAAMIDYNNVLFQSEYNEFDSEDFQSTGYLLGLGYRIKDFTPVISYSKYRDEDPDFGKQVNNATSFSIRWDFYPSAALTLQYDILDDQTRWFEDVDGDTVVEQYSFTGDSKVIALGLDYVF